MNSTVGAERRPGVNASHASAPSRSASPSGYALQTMDVDQLDVEAEIGTTKNCQTTIVADTPKMQPSRRPSRTYRPARALAIANRPAAMNGYPARYQTSAMDTSGRLAPTNA